jgi:hypothetical protein
MIVEEARDLTIQLDWGDFRSGFSIVEVEACEREDIEGLTRYDIQTDFPEGAVTVSGVGLMILRSKESWEIGGLELPFGVRNALASDDELRRAFAAAKSLSPLP